MELNFSVQSEDQNTRGPSYLIRIIQAPPSQNTNWTAVVTAPGTTLYLTDASTPTEGVLVLPSSATGAVATFNFTVARGATIFPSRMSVSSIIPQRGTWLNYTFTVTGELLA